MKNTCSICKAYINDKDPALKLRHQGFHKRFLIARDYFNLELLPYETREAKKRSGRDLLKTSLTIEEKVKGALIILESYFHRSLDASISRNAWKKHPEFSVYLQLLKLPNSLIPDPIMKEIKNKYGHKKSAMPFGETYWQFKYIK